MIRCCLCHQPLHLGTTQAELTDLPGSGWRCADHDACAQRVRDIVSAHKGLAEI